MAQEWAGGDTYACIGSGCSGFGVLGTVFAVAIWVDRIIFITNMALLCKGNNLSLRTLNTSIRLLLPTPETVCDRLCSKPVSRVALIPWASTTLSDINQPVETCDTSLALV